MAVPRWGSLHVTSPCASLACSRSRPLFAEATEASGLTESCFPGLAMAQKQYFIHGELTGFLPASRLLSLSMGSVSWARVLFPTQRQPQVPGPAQEEAVGNGQEGGGEEGKGTGSTWTPPPATPA